MRGGATENIDRSSNSTTNSPAAWDGGMYSNVVHIIYWYTLRFQNVCLHVIQVDAILLPNNDK